MPGLKLIGEVALDGSGFVKGLESIGHTAVHNFRNLVVAAFGVTSLHQAIHHTVETVSELVEASQRLDLTIEQLQVMRQTAKQAVVDFQKVERALEAINVVREKALTGKPDNETLGFFKRLGVTEDNLRHMTAGNIMTGPMAEATKRMSVQDLDAAFKALLPQVRGFGELIPFLKKDFGEVGDSMRKMGLIIDTGVAVQIKIMQEEMSILSNFIVSALAPALVMLADVALWAAGKFKIAQDFYASLFGHYQAGDFTVMDFIDDKLGKMDAAVQNLLFGSVKNQDPVSVAAMNKMKPILQDVAQDTVKSGAEVDAAREEFNKRIAEMVERINHPPVPTIAPGLEAKAEKLKTGKTIKSDSLVAVGNFLGSGRTVLESIAGKQLEYTRQTVVALNRLVGYASHEASAVTMGDDGDLSEY